MIIIDKNAKREVQVKYPDKTRVLFPNLDDGYISSNDIVIPSIDAPISDGGVAEASINDGAEGNAISKLVISIDPVQDLHGQNNPYPPGGGKNKLADTIVNGQIGSTGGYSESSNRVTNAVAESTPVLSTTYLTAGTYTLSCVGLNNCTVLSKDENGEIIDNFAEEWHNLPYTFTLTSDAYVLFTARKSDNSNISPSDYKPQIEVGETATTFAPYSNICPISGWSEAKVTRSGDNSITDTYTIDLKGTRYGGTLDVTTGVLTVDRAIVTLNGSENWSLWNSTGKKLFAVVPLMSDSNFKPLSSSISNQFKFIGRYGAPPYAMQEGDYLFNAGDNINWNKNVSFYYPSIGEDVADWKTYLSQNNLQVTYELATPFTVQLTPQEITTLLGNNTISADCGNVLELSYSANMNIRLQDLLDEKLDKPTTPGTLGQVLTSDGEGSQTWETPE